ncbi:MAG: MurR/RpiR family transcriptional regulator [Atopobiaceae bacterium]
MREGRLNLLMSLFAVFNDNDRDDTSYALARYFLQNFDHLDQLNIYDVMDSCFVSRSGVRRFCQSIGFENFSEIKARSDEWQLFRHYFLTYPRLEQAGSHNLRHDLDQLYGQIDELMDTREVDVVLDALHRCDQLVLFSADSSSMSLVEFQRAMALEGRIVQLITESSPAADAVRELGPNDLLLAVSTSGAFVRRQQAQIRDSGAFKVYVTATRSQDLQQLFDTTLSMATDVQGPSPLHRMYASYGVAYLFDRLFSAYAHRYDDQLSLDDGSPSR